MSENELLSDPSAYERGVFLIVNRQIIPLKKQVTTLGRQLENDIVFHEEYLSRFHAEIIYENRTYILCDKDSTSGTSVNGQKIDRCVLNSGDLISLANISIMFVNNNPKIAGTALGTTHSLHRGELPDRKESHA